jgi:hypothetical protein
MPSTIITGEKGHVFGFMVNRITPGDVGSRSPDLKKTIIGAHGAFQDGEGRVLVLSRDAA